MVNKPSIQHPRRKSKPIKLDGLAVEEALVGLLKVKPPIDKPKRGGKKKADKGEPATLKA